jgi:hypothetical protein
MDTTVRFGRMTYSYGDLATEITTAADLRVGDR